jgi:hypothetical protein
MQNGACCILHSAFPQGVCGNNRAMLHRYRHSSVIAGGYVKRSAHAGTHKKKLEVALLCFALLCFALLCFALLCYCKKNFCKGKEKMLNNPMLSEKF